METSLQPLWAETVNIVKQEANEKRDVLEDILSALWVSANSPLASDILVEEWLETDIDAQNYIKQHFHYDPSRSSGELPHQEDEKAAKEWKRQMDEFHANNENPSLYQYICRPHSTDYYNTYRQTFYEHFLWFLAFTGKSHQLFPERMPASLIRHYEQLRYAWMKAALKRQADEHKKKTVLKAPPLDSLLSFETEEQIKNFYESERDYWQDITADAMADYCFLSYPAIPCEPNREAVDRLVEREGSGTVYSLEGNSRYWFFVPDEPSYPNPSECVNVILESMGHGFKSPGYRDLLKLWAKALERRYTVFKADDETVRQAFLSRIPIDDPCRAVYEAYVKQFEQVWEIKKTLYKIKSVDGA